MIALLVDIASAADTVPDGKVTDAWSYVIAAYVITWASFGLYTMSLYWRSRSEEA